MIDDLRERGVTRATFHPDGSLASVEYGHLAPTGDTQHEDLKDQPKRAARAVGGLKPRVGDST